ncbi:MAG: hypothetical protein ACUVV6_09170 [Thermoplasmatota archaeon]
MRGNSHLTAWSGAIADAPSPPRFAYPIVILVLVFQGDRMKMMLELAGIDEIQLLPGYRFRRPPDAA